MNNEKKISFWKLITDYSIEIPTIQRDYTYGRESAQEISRKLINAILSSCLELSKKLHLDFIYGKLEGKENFHLLEKNKHSIDSLLQAVQHYATNLYLNVDFATSKKSEQQSEIVTFIPLDGQQRLTTLFLIHWYFIFIKKDEKCLDILKRFTYTTRNSSKEFLQLICQPRIFDLKTEKGLAQGILNDELFFTSWKKDPTVNSMLSVIDQIEGFVKEKSINSDQAWEALTKLNTVSFDFFDLDEFDLTDELYVKMNARGKSLSGFENFKAWLLKNYKGKIGDPNLGRKLDIDWFDLFWVHAEGIKDVEEIDNKYLQFFKNLYLSDYLLEKYNSENSASEINTDKHIELLRTSTQKNLIPLLESNETFSRNIDLYIRLLDNLKVKENDYNFNKNFQTNSLKKYFFKNNQSLNFPNNTYQYALSRYIIHTNGDFAFFEQWARVLGNLIFNTTLETAYLHRNACKSIDTLIQSIGSENVYQKIAQLDGCIEFFDGEQVSEEILKSQLIIQHPELNWEALFIELEAHRYFYGQIGFILEIAHYDFNDLVIKGKKIQALFSEEVLNKNNHLLFRTFLSQMDSFFNPEIHRYYFPRNIRGTLRERNENWRRFIKGNLALIERIISHQQFDENNIVHSLEVICKSFQSNDKYTLTILSSPKVLQYANQHHIRKYNHSIFLLSSTRISGYFSELFTLSWYLSNTEKFINLNMEYIYGKGENSNPKISFKFRHQTIFLDFNRHLGKFGFYRNDQSPPSDNVYVYTEIEDAVDAMIKENNQS